MRLWHAVLMIVALSLVSGYFDWRHLESERAKYAQAGYDRGRMVGKVLGSCETLQGVVNANPDSLWAASTAVTSALTGCARLQKQHAPDAKEMIRPAKLKVQPNAQG